MIMIIQASRYSYQELKSTNRFTGAKALAPDLKEDSAGIYCLFLGIILHYTGILSSFCKADVWPTWALPGHNDKKSISRIFRDRSAFRVIRVGLEVRWRSVIYLCNSSLLLFGVGVGADHERSCFREEE